MEQVVTVPHCRVRLCCLQDLSQDVTACAELVILDVQSAFKVWDHHSDVMVHQLIGLQVQLALDQGRRGREGQGRGKGEAGERQGRGRGGAREGKERGRGGGGGGEGQGRGKGEAGEGKERVWEER